MLKNHTTLPGKSPGKPVFKRCSRPNVRPSQYVELPPAEQKEQPSPPKHIPLLSVTNPPVFTDFNWALAKAAEAGNVDRVLADWERRRRKKYPKEWEAVRRAFEASRQTVLYLLNLKHVDQAIRTTEHALGDVVAREAAGHEYKFAKNASPGYPVIMLFHDLMEKIGRVPLWQDVERYLFERQELCLAYYYRAGRVDPPVSIEDLWVGGKKRAIRYRIACLYYSFLRDVHAIVALRERHGLDVRYHPLLDAEWKADALFGLVRIELYVINPEYKQQDEERAAGRKAQCKMLNPGLPVLAEEMKPRRVWGKCWVYNDASLAKLASKIREASVSH
jgi:hypothetical protein